MTMRIFVNPSVKYRREQGGYIARDAHAEYVWLDEWEFHVWQSFAGIGRSRDELTACELSIAKGLISCGLLMEIDEATAAGIREGK